MSGIKDFAYAQARLQARHGARPTPATWRRLESIRDLAHLLQVAQRSELRPWVVQLTAHTSPHDLECELREQLRRHILEVADWHPQNWRPAFHWTARLIDLPALQHLLSGQPVWPWLEADPAIRPFTLASREGRLDARLQASDCAVLLIGRQQGESLLETWLGHWRGLWPKMPSSHRQSLDALVRLLGGHLAALTSTASEQQSSEPARGALEERLSRRFRRHIQQPATGFLHLSLVALDLERLRGVLLTRKLFPERAPETAA